MRILAPRRYGSVALALGTLAGAVLAPGRLAAQGSERLGRTELTPSTSSEPSHLEPARGILHRLVGTWRFEIWFAGNYGDAPDAAGTRMVKALFDDLRLEWTEQLDHTTIELFGPLQAQVVEQRLHHACSRRIGRVAVVPREPDLEAPRADQPVEDAAGRLEVRRLGGRARRTPGPAESLATLGGEPPGSEDRPGERAERQSDRSVSAGSVDSHGPGGFHGLCHW